MKKIHAVLLCLLLAMAVVPALAASDLTSVGGPAINYSNGLPLSDETYKAGSGTITWDAASKTLTLDDASVTSAEISSGQGLIMLPENVQETVEIKLNGANTFDATKSYAASSLIKTGKSHVVITGNGDLTTTNIDRGVFVSGNNSGASIEFSGTGKIAMTCRSAGLYVNAGKGGIQKRHARNDGDEL